MTRRRAHVLAHDDADRGDLVGGAGDRASGTARLDVVLRPEDLPSMTECFLLSSTKDITPVGAIDELCFSVGPATVSTRLKEAFGCYYRESAAAHPDLKV